MKKGMVVLIAGLLFMWGCATPRQATVQDQTATSQDDEALNTAFYTFPDIPVPKELTFQRGKSFIYETPSVKAGVLVLSGNIDVGSLSPPDLKYWFQGAAPWPLLPCHAR